MTVLRSEDLSWSEELSGAGELPPAEEFPVDVSEPFYFRSEASRTFGATYAEAQKLLRSAVDRLDQLAPEVDRLERLLTQESAPSALAREELQLIQAYVRLRQRVRYQELFGTPGATSGSGWADPWGSEAGTPRDGASTADSGTMNAVSGDTDPDPPARRRAPIVEAVFTMLTIFGFFGLALIAEALSGAVSWFRPALGLASLVVALMMLIRHVGFRFSRR